MLGALLPHYINFQVHQILLRRGPASLAQRWWHEKRHRQCERPDQGLTLEYNKMRQAAITSELLEITTPQMALGN
ncbi:MAG: hypothetical protein CM1200mP34_4920 [Verrucomicrobiales bacterium]|nr:MAG: hypothetical protein CM1200mP34_4920 [Verrucomicrobiales bacterium]